MKKGLPFLFLFVFLIVGAQKSFAHCEIPCGIYEDSVRVYMIREHISTIEKSMNQIVELSNAEKPNYNQLVRWVTNKETHAEKIQEIVSQYFLHQRIKIKEENDPGYDKYQLHLRLLHQISVYAMKSKQTTDLDYIKKMRMSVDAFEKSYFHHDHKH